MIKNLLKNRFYSSLNFTSKQSQRNAPLSKEELKNALPPTYFAGKPIYYDTLSFISFNIERLRQKQRSDILSIDSDGFDSGGIHGAISESNASQKQHQWMDLKTLKNKWNIPLDREEHQELIQQLEQLNEINQSLELKDQKISEFISQFYANQAHDGFTHRADSSADTPVIDQYGRVYAQGIRRKLLNHVWLTPFAQTDSMKQNTILINGVDFKQVLPSMKDRFLISQVFDPEIIDKFNVFCKLESSMLEKNEKLKEIIQGGQSSIGSEINQLFGSTNITDSIINGTSRALLKLFNHVKNQETENDFIKLLQKVSDDQSYIKQLQEFSLADQRQRERKKPGQPSARAQFQWVKR